MEDFAVWRKVQECEILSDDGQGSESDSDEAMEGTLNMYAGRKIWEWRFALQVEDASQPASKKAKPERMWVVVDNFEAQALLGLDAIE